MAALGNGYSGCRAKGKGKRKAELAYERFLSLPVPVVLAMLWLAGVGLIGLSVGGSTRYGYCCGQ
jgi:hypothetical protein